MCLDPDAPDNCEVCLLFLNMKEPPPHAQIEGPALRDSPADMSAMTSDAGGSTATSVGPTKRRMKCGNLMVREQ
jgi:hypothetical protein